MIDVLKELLRCLPDPTCEDFHHNKRDYHSGYDECPVLKRYEEAVECANKLITSGETK